MLVRFLKLPPTNSYLFQLTGASDLTVDTDIDPIVGINFFGGDGNDTFSNLTSIPSTAYGEAGTDELNGGSANDVLFGGADNDTLPSRGLVAVTDFMETKEMTRSSAAKGMTFSMALPGQITFTVKPETTKSSATQVMTSFTLATETTTYTAALAMTSSKVKPVQMISSGKMARTISKAMKVMTTPLVEKESTSLKEAMEPTKSTGMGKTTNYTVKPVMIRSSDILAMI